MDVQSSVMLSTSQTIYLNEVKKTQTMSILRHTLKKIKIHLQNF